MRTIRNCNVAVVGGAGFLGSHLVDHLIEDRGCNVVVVDNLEAGQVAFVHKAAKRLYHDITSSEAVLYDLFRYGKVRFVFNYAARPYVPDSYERPLRTWDVNAMGALKVINAAQEAGVEAILQVSSAEVYGGWNYMGDFDNPEHVSDQMSEDSPIQPCSSYGASKAVIDAACQIRWREAKTPVIALRQFNAYGPRETHDYVIPTIISQIHRNGSRIKLGNNSTRDFQYARDAVCCAVELLERGSFGEVYNLGSERSIKIYDLAKLIGNLMGCDVEIEKDEARVRPWEIWHLASSNSKINSVIEYRHQTPLEEGLRKTIASFVESGGRWTFEGG